MLAPLLHALALVLPFCATLALLLVQREAQWTGHATESLGAPPQESRPRPPYHLTIEDREPVARQVA